MFSSTYSGSHEHNSREISDVERSRIRRVPVYKHPSNDFSSCLSVPRSVQDRPVRSRLFGDSFKVYETVVCRSDGIGS